MSNLQYIPKESVLTFIVEELGVTECLSWGNNKLLELIIAEYIRYFIIIETHAGTPVHINRIIGHISSKLFSLLRANINFELVSVGDKHSVSIILNKLITNGEVEHVGEGFYVATPTRLVELPSGNGLLISCLPRKHIAKNYGFVPSLTGLTKTILAANLKEVSQKLTEGHIPLAQTFNEWLELPSISTVQWVEEKLKVFKRKLKEIRVSTESFEIYDPAIGSKQLHALRWKTIDSKMKRYERSLSLFRTKTYPRRYWLGEVILVNGEPKLISEMDISVSVVRRMLYGIDTLESNPTNITIIYNTKECDVFIPNLLPDEEMRFFIALGFDVRRDKNKLPLHFKLPVYLLEDIQHLMVNLGVYVKLRREH